MPAFHGVTSPFVSEKELQGSRGTKIRLIWHSSRTSVEISEASAD